MTKILTRISLFSLVMHNAPSLARAGPSPIYMPLRKLRSAPWKLVEASSSQDDPRRRGRLPCTGPARHLNPHGTHDDDKLNS